jgi:phospholipid transport system transporter-binding protein
MPQLTQESSGDYSLTGPLNFNTVTALHREAQIDMSKSQVSVSLRHVDHSDSAGLALLVEWVRLADKHRCSLRYTDIPAQLQILIDVTGLRTILNSAAT